MILWSYVFLFLIRQTLLSQIVFDDPMTKRTAERKHRPPTSLFYSGEAVTAAELAPKLLPGHKIHRFECCCGRLDRGGAQLVSQISDLRCLNLLGSNFPDDAPRYFCRCVKLRVLIFSRTELTDQGLVWFANNAEVRTLMLDGTRITGAGLCAVRAMTKLEFLSCDDTSVDDIGLQHIAELSNLRVLSLLDTQVSDRGLATLGRLNKLQRIDIGGPNITKKGIARLRRMLPSATINVAFLNRLLADCSVADSKINLRQR